MEITHQHTYPKSHLLNLRNHGNKKHGWNKNIRYVHKYLKEISHQKYKILKGQYVH